MKLQTMTMAMAALLMAGWLPAASAQSGARTFDTPKAFADDGRDPASRRVVGIFQGHDPVRQTVKISDVEYELGQTLGKQGGKMRDFRNGQRVLFAQGAVPSESGRNVVTTIDPY